VEGVKCACVGWDVNKKWLSNPWLFFQPPRPHPASSENKFEIPPPARSSRFVTALGHNAFTLSLLLFLW